MSRSQRFGIMPGAALAAAAAMIVGGCGSSGTSAKTSPTTAKAASGTPLVFGVISSDTGKTGTTTDQSTTVTNWAQYINTHGGINGHPVTIKYFDDTDSSATAIQDATTLIQNDHVIAIGDASQTAASFASVADAANVPVISLVGDHSAPNYVKDPNLFADSATVPTLFWDYANVAALSGAKNIGLLYCAEVAACAQLVPAVKAYATPLGVNIVYSAGFSGSAPNYTAICLAAQQAGATNLTPVGPVVAADARVLDDCAAQGYHPSVIQSGTNLGPTILGDPNIQHFWAFSNTIPNFVHNSVTNTIDSVMGSYLTHALSQQNVFDDWAGLQLFAAAAKNIPTNATPMSQDIYNGLYSLHGYTEGGFSVPLTFNKGVPNPVLCSFVFKYDSGTFSLPEGITPQCEQSATSTSTTSTTG